MSKPKEVLSFADNWAYLKAELAWLDQLLMMAVSRQKREIQEVDEIALSGQDRVTSHWWKGIIALNGQPGYDHARPPRSGQSLSATSGQQIEGRIQASQRQGVVLALPHLRDQLQLSPFEKNVILMALAPEINQRFGRLYGYLQYHHEESDWDLPTVDLCLRLLCRNDVEWRQARPLIAPDSRLVNLGLVEWASGGDTTLLSRHLRLTEALTTYLLAESPDPALVGTWASVAGPPLWQAVTLADEPDLVVPPKVWGQLETVCALAQAPGHPLVLLAGPAGTGKSRAARDLARRLKLPMVALDLAAIAPDRMETVLEGLATLPPGLLLVKTAQHWLGRSPLLEPALVQQGLAYRRQRPGLTLLTTHHLHTIRPSWHQGLDGTIEFPFPSAADRLALWRQAVPPEVKLAPDLRWASLAKLRLTGGEIKTVVTTAIALTQWASSPTLTLTDLQQALALHHPTLKWSPPAG